MTSNDHMRAANPNIVVSQERLLGTAKRWRRHGEPNVATNENSEHRGVFGPGSLAWDVLLHPAVIVFQSPAQFILQLTYKPVVAGVRDWDPISKKAHRGELTLFDVFDRGQRNSGIHAPMWLGDKDTATRVAQHLIRIHEKVEGDVIDVGAPEIGGYQANSPRESMWAALTEMHSMLWVYERLGFHGLALPRRLPDNLRDRYIAEVSEYCRLFPHDENELPKSMADLKQLYKKYDDLFGVTKTLATIPATGQNFHQLWKDSIEKNYHPSQRKVKLQLFFQEGLFKLLAMAAVSAKARKNSGLSPKKEKAVLAARVFLLPVVWLLQQRPIESYFLRMMWGPDAVEMVAAARKLHAEAKRA
ncbi:oxygenase MpaB family protein [Thalassospira sp. UBA1131]|uniref:oxygenase MpaB family protein n=1 Tax=Thalassospira sp. UBA1131 TaxID=1947672 RepID=UPI0025CF5E19|nr:oxygenase MpaB family protein [Thalassospira sp. UBA1131]